MFHHLYYKFLEAPLLIRILGMALFFIIFFGAAVHWIEPQTFPTVFEGIWWAVVTASTVGFGDYAPKTTIGRLLGIGLILVGAGFLSSYFIHLATATVATQNSLREGKTMYGNKKHLVIIGWNERSKEVIDQLQALSVPKHIVLIDHTLQTNPYPEKMVHFIHGAPFKDQTLMRANIKDASLALITSDPDKNELHADMNSILTLVAMKGSNPELYCIVEILTKDQVINAKRAGANEVIETNRHASSMMVSSLYADGISHTVSDLLNPSNGGHLSWVNVEKKWDHYTFEQLVALLIKDEILFIGLQRGGKTYINPPPTFIIHLNDKLLTIIH